MPEVQSPVTLGSRALGPADRVTAVRLGLACVVAAIAVWSVSAPDDATAVALLVGITSIALLLDLVDGRVARRTGTASAFGARFDMEVDAFLILVLSVYVAATGIVWALVIGAARYLFLAASRVWPWLRGETPPRYWAKVVAAVQGIALTVVAADVLPGPVERILLGGALVLLVESFGRQVWKLWSLRHDPAAARWLRCGGRVRSVTLTALAGLVVWAALVLPNRADGLSVADFLRIPVELLVVLALAMVLPVRLRRVVCVGFGVLVALLVLVKLLDIGFYAVFDRPFDLLNDDYYLGPAVGVLADSSGRAVAVAAVVGVALASIALLVGLPLAVLRIARVVAGRRRTAAPVLGVLAVAWLTSAAASVVVGGVPFASTSTDALAVGQVRQLHADLVDRGTFAREIASDDLAGTPTSGLLAGLRGKDVLLVFVESYGRVAVQNSTVAPGVDGVLDSGTERLQAAGFSARSAFLTSPTFGAGSWLAHSTLQSGLWVDSQQRYNQLVTGQRLTLTDAFGRAGWRTVFDVPANTKDWPEGSFYRFDKLYDSRNVGYRGPRFSYATMPDQYTLSALWRDELAPRNRPPVMAEVDLVSSHHPWTPLPRLVPWNAVGDGSVFDPMPAQGRSPDDVFRHPADVRAAYGRSIEYSLDTLVSFAAQHPDPNLVMVVLGDHQPHTYVSGDHPGHDVPVSVIAHDPWVLDRIAGWGWQPGLHPSPAAPVWPMNDFRNRFLAAFDS